MTKLPSSTEPPPFHDLGDPLVSAERVTALLEQCATLGPCTDLRAFVARTY